MDENNKFLSHYKKRMQDETESREVSVSPHPENDLRYEETNGFVKPPVYRKPPPEKKRNIIVPIIIGAVVLAAIVTTLLVLLNQGVQVADFKGWTKADTQLWAANNGVLLQSEEKYDDAVETGKVISQNVKTGTVVKRGSFIGITVSLGHDLTVTLPLPDLKSMTKDQVQAWATENFMEKVRITAEFSEAVPAGNVISYEINDNTVVDKVSRNTPIYVVVSKGKEENAAALITVPNFKEKNLSECYAFANENGITLKVNEQFDDYVPKGSILSQSIKADMKIAKGTVITLAVSKGKEIKVPDFSGYSKEKATAEAGALGINVTFAEKYSSAAEGKFISQNLEAGSVYEAGDILELRYSLGNKIVLASYVGQLRDAIETWAKDLNAKGAKITIKVTSTVNNAAKGTIIYQDKASTVIGVKATIHITVSKGKVLHMPDFVASAGSGYDTAVTREKALAMCADLNIVPVFVEAAKSGRLPGEVWSQSISAGTEVSEGSTVTLKYTPNRVKTEVPDFKGMTKDQILAGNYFKSLDITFVDGDAYEAGSDGKVYKQSVRAGSKVAYGTAITLTVRPKAAP